MSEGSIVKCGLRGRSLDIDSHSLECKRKRKQLRSFFFISFKVRGNAGWVFWQKRRFTTSEDAGRRSNEKVKFQIENTPLPQGRSVVCNVSVRDVARVTQCAPCVSWLGLDTLLFAHLLESSIEFCHHHHNTTQHTSISRSKDSHPPDVSLVVVSFPDALVNYYYFFF